MNQHDRQSTMKKRPKAKLLKQDRPRTDGGGVDGGQRRGKDGSNPGAGGIAAVTQRGEAVESPAARRSGAIADLSPPEVDLSDPSFYLNRELGMIAFNNRVCEEAEDPTDPLLERVKFLAIVDSNLHEFFMVRVAGLKQQVAAGVAEKSADGLTPAEQLAAVRKDCLKLMKRAAACYKHLAARLEEAGIHILGHDQLSDKQRDNVRQYFQEFVYPVLTPLAFDPGRPFPFISNLSLNIAVILRDKTGEERFARIKVPSTLPSLVPLKRSSGGLRKDGTVPHNHYFMWLEDVIRAHLQTLFPGLEIIEAHPFHVVRDADLSIQELEAADLLETVEESLKKRRFGGVVRLTLHPDTPDRIRELLVRELGVDDKDIYALEGPLRLRGLWALHDIERLDLRDAPFKPSVPALLAGESGNIFDRIRENDILIHHPFDSFAPVLEFLETAAADPDVLAIKITLYRVGRNSPVVDALLEAQQNDKQVCALVELKARFDEESNISWARMLENEGVHVVYGLLGLKTHSKVALVVRREGQHIRRYVHLSTGNYNHETANLYTDISMFTIDERITEDATDLFNYLTGYSERRDYRKLMVAPVNLRASIESLISREIEHQRQGGQGRLIFKMNALVDKKVIRHLYEASQAGVDIDLIVRGICCLRPGVPGLSDNIRVRSIVGRFLEHSRIYYYRNGGDEEIYLGSADLMPRNIDHRVEVLFPVRKQEHVRHLREVVLETYLADDVKARIMRADGSYVRMPGDGEHVNSQERLISLRH